MDHIGKQKTLCSEFHDGNKFCYEFKEDVDNADHSKPSASKYGFNGQKRAVPGQASDILTMSNVTHNCGFYCNEKLGGMSTSQTPESLIPGVRKVANRIVSYSDLGTFIWEIIFLLIPETCLAKQSSTFKKQC